MLKWVGPGEFFITFSSNICITSWNLLWKHLGVTSFRILVYPYVFAVSPLLFLVLLEQDVFYWSSSLILVVRPMMSCHFLRNFLTFDTLSASAKEWCLCQQPFNNIENRLSIANTTSMHVEIAFDVVNCFCNKSRLNKWMSYSSNSHDKSHHFLDDLMCSNVLRRRMDGISHGPLSAPFSCVKVIIQYLPRKKLFTLEVLILS